LVKEKSDFSKYPESRTTEWTEHRGEKGKFWLNS